MDGLTVGRIVHVRTPRGDRCQPAIVAIVWPNEFDGEPGINAVVFRDGSNDNRHDDGNDALTRWATSIREGQEANQFHDPRACTATQ